MWCKVKTNNLELDHVQEWLLQGIRTKNFILACDKCCLSHKQFWEPINRDNIMLKLKKNKLLHKWIVWEHLFHESLFSFVLPSIWLEKKHNNKVLIGLCGGEVCWFLEIKIYVPWPSFYNNIFALRLLVVTTVVSHCHCLQQQ